MFTPMTTRYWRNCNFLYLHSCHFFGQEDVIIRELNLQIGQLIADNHLTAEWIFCKRFLSKYDYFPAQRPKIMQLVREMSIRMRD
jgi:hypothetical protein